MEYRTLGRSGLNVSAIAMGTFSFGGEGAFAKVASQGVSEARRLVDVCLEGGVNLFDTANCTRTADPRRSSARCSKADATRS